MIRLEISHWGLDYAVLTIWEGKTLVGDMEITLGMAHRIEKALKKEKA